MNVGAKVAGLFQTFEVGDTFTKEMVMGLLDVPLTSVESKRLSGALSALMSIYKVAERVAGLTPVTYRKVREWKDRTMRPYISKKPSVMMGQLSDPGNLIMSTAEVGEAVFALLRKRSDQVDRLVEEKESMSLQFRDCLEENKRFLRRVRGLEEEVLSLKGRVKIVDLKAV